MIKLGEIVDRVSYWRIADRIGPDIPWTHWRLHFKSSMRRLCESQFLAFGDGSEFRPGAYAINCKKISIGSNVVIRPGTSLFADGRENGGKILIDSDALIGSNCHVYTLNHRFANPAMKIIDQGHDDPDERHTVRIESGCWIGANVTILPGVVIGKNAVVAAGSVVTKSVEARTLVAGVPATLIRHLE